MQDLKFPIQFEFKITTLANDFVATDAEKKVVAYVRQKMFRLKEDVQVFSDESQSAILYTIKADRWLDFNAAYSLRDKEGKEFGKLTRKGWRSIWRASYFIIDEFNQEQYTISEENAWAKVMDGIFGEIPILGFFTGYLFHPKYMVKDKSGKGIVRLTKTPSFFGRRFELSALGEMDQNDDDRILLSLMMMILLERSRG